MVRNRGEMYKCQYPSYLQINPASKIGFLKTGIRAYPESWNRHDFDMLLYKKMGD